MSVPIRPQVIETPGLGLDQAVAGLIQALGQKNAIQQAREKWAQEKLESEAKIRESEQRAKLMGTQNDTAKQELKMLQEKDKQQAEDLAAAEEGNALFGQWVASGADDESLSKIIVGIKDAKVAQKFTGFVKEHFATKEQGGQATQAVEKGKQAKIETGVAEEVEAKLAKDPHLKKLRTYAQIGAMGYLTTQISASNSEKVSSREMRLADIRTFNAAIDKAMTAYKDTETALIKKSAEAISPALGKEAQRELAELRAKGLKGFVDQYETEAAAALQMTLPEYRAARRKAITGFEGDIKGALGPNDKRVVTQAVQIIRSRKGTLEQFLQNPAFSPEVKAAVQMQLGAE